MRITMAAVILGNALLEFIVVYGTNAPKIEAIR